MTGHVLSMADLSGTEIEEILDLAEQRDARPVFKGRGAALIFEHPSARTRNAMEMAVVQQGGHPVTIRGEEIGFDVRESVEDVARTLASYHHLIGARVAKHDTLARMARALDAAEVHVPVINLLSDYEHPSQCLADLLTIRQCFGSLTGVRVAYIGDANNVCRSLAIGCALTGTSIVVASPDGYALSDLDRDLVLRLGGEIECVSDPHLAASGADVLYTDVWVSMGEYEQATAKRAAFAGYCIDETLLGQASPNAIVMHCLPAHRGEEVSAAVIDGPQSRIWQQAANRMHALRGLIGLLFKDQRP